MSTPWPEADLELLRRRWSEGASDSQIARELDWRYTRNAVIGMRHRRRITREPSIGNEVSRLYGKRQEPHVPELSKETETGEEVVLNDTGTSPDGPQLDATPPPSATAGAVTLLELRPHHCRWVSDDYATYCGAQRVEGKPYCGPHCAVAHVSARPRTGVRPDWRPPHMRK